MSLAKGTSNSNQTSPSNKARPSIFPPLFLIEVLLLHHTLNSKLLIKARGPAHEVGFHGQWEKAWVLTLAQGQIHTALIPPSRFSPCFPQVSHSESIQACPITGSRCTFLDYTRLKCSFVFSCLCDLFLNSMAYFHNPAVILQNLCPWNLRGMLIKRWLTCCTKIPWSKNSVFLFSMCHIFRCDLFPAAWNGQTTVTIFLHNILSAATLIFMSPLYLDL